MADDRTKRGPQDRSRISLQEEYEVQYWTKTLGVTVDELKAAIKRVGRQRPSKTSSPADGGRAALGLQETIIGLRHRGVLRALAFGVLRASKGR
jgi:hypothetical protein